MSLSVFKPAKPSWPFVLNKDSDQAHGLIGYWPMEPGAGRKCFDLSGKGFHGTLTSFVPGSTSGWTFGRDGGRSLYFDGTDDSVSMGTVLLNTSGPLTIAGWLRMAVGIGEYAAFVTKGNIGGARNYTLAFNPGAMDNIWAYGICESTQPVISVTLATNVWYHIAAVRDVGGQGGILYVNGRNVYSDAGGAGDATAEPFSIGRSAGGFEPFKGNIESVLRYDRALTKNEIWSLYDPATRWQLRYQTGRRAWSFPALAAAGLSIPVAANSYRQRRVMV